MSNANTVLTRDITNQGKRYSVTPLGSTPSQAKATDEISLDEVRFQPNYDLPETADFGHFGCNTIGLGTSSGYRLVKLRFNGLDFVDDEGNIISKANHVFGTQHGLFAVLDGTEGN